MFRLINNSRNDLNHTFLKKELNLPGSEITRHTKRLLASNLILKELNGIYRVTNFGYLIYQILDYVEFSVKFQDFINSFDIRFLPEDLLMQLGLLKDCHLLTKTVENIETWFQMITNANELIWSVSDQFQFSIIPSIQKKIENTDLEIRAILEKGLLKKIVNSDIIENYLIGKRPEAIKVFNEKIGIPENIRKIENVNIALTITESETILFLATTRGIDYSFALYAKNNDNFSKWAKILFNFLWKKSEVFEIEDLTRTDKK